MSPSGSALGGLALLTTPLAFVLGTASDLNAVFTMFLTIGIGSFAIGAFAARTSARKTWLVVSGAACGLAFLTKGFLAFALPAVVLLPFAAWERRWRELFRSCWVSIAAALVVAAPWAVAIARREPEFWRTFVVNEHLRRFAAADAQHVRPPWFYAAVLLGGALPWVSFLPLFFPCIRRTSSMRSAERFAVCWLILPLILFSVSRGKLASYALPLLPPLVVLVVAGLERGLRAFRSSGVRAVARVHSVGLLAIAAGLFLAAVPHSTLADHLPFTMASTDWVVLGLAAVAGAVMSLCALRSSSSATQVVLLGSALAPLLLGLHFVRPLGIDARMPGEALRAVARGVDDDAILASTARIACAICWEYRRDDVMLLWPFVGELAAGLDGGSGDRVLRREELHALVVDPERSRQVVVVARHDHLSRLHPLPAPTRRFDRGTLSVCIWDPVVDAE